MNDLALVAAAAACTLTATAGLAAALWPLVTGAAPDVLLTPRAIGAALDEIDDRAEEPLDVQLTPLTPALPWTATADALRRTKEY